MSILTVPTGEIRFIADLRTQGLEEFSTGRTHIFKGPLIVLKRELCSDKGWKRLEFSGKVEHQEQENTYTISTPKEGMVQRISGESLDRADWLCKMWDVPRRIVVNDAIQFFAHAVEVTMESEQVKDRTNAMTVTELARFLQQRFKRSLPGDAQDAIFLLLAEGNLYDVISRVRKEELRNSLLK